MTPERLTKLCELFTEQPTVGPYEVREQDIKDDPMEVLSEVWGHCLDGQPRMVCQGLGALEADLVCNLLDAFPALARATCDRILLSGIHFSTKGSEAYKQLDALVSRCEAAQKGDGK